MLDSGRRPPSALKWLFLIPLLVGLFEALRTVWVCDDVFISFRYVDHLLRGEGLVFNPGERVEGYTHFLWVIVLAALNRLGLDLVALGRYLPLVPFAVMLWILWQRSSSRAAAGWLGIPLAAWALALHKDVQIYASSGLETAAFALLLLLGVLVLAGEQPRLGLAAVVYALATLTRPEGGLYTAAAGVYVLWRWRSVHAVLAFSAIWLALVAPSMVFRLLYYGDVVPNTYYAKSGGSSWWGQGWQYTRLYFSIYPGLLLAVLAIPISWLLFLRHPRPESRSGHEHDVALLAGVQALLSILYVMRLGGDFMFARFLIPATPLLLLVLEDVLRRSARRWVEVVCTVILVGLTLYARLPRERTFPGRERVSGIVNEANYYTGELVEELRHQGEVLGEVLRNTPARVGLLSGQDAVAFFGHLPYALEPHGLTDPEIARMPIEQRGRPGHEKAATLEHLLSKKIHFRLRYGFTWGLRMHQQIRFRDLHGEIIHYDRTLLEQLRRRGEVNFLDFGQFLDDYVTKLDQQQSRRLLEDYRDFQLFYFVHNEDPQRLQRYRKALLDFGVPEAGLRAADQQVAEFMAKVRKRS